MTSQLLVTLDGIRDDSAGLALHELQDLDEVLDKVSSVLAMYAGHSSGHPTLPGQFETWIHTHRLLELRRSAPGCLSARWTLGPLPEVGPDMPSDESRAVEVLLESSGRRGEPSEASLQDYIDEISDALPKGVLLWLGDSDNPNRISIKHNDDSANELSSRDEALVSDLHAIGLRCAALLQPGPSATDHGDLLYDERGLPK